MLSLQPLPQQSPLSQSCIPKTLTPTIAKFSVTGGLTLNVNFRVQQKFVRNLNYKNKIEFWTSWNIAEIPRVRLQNKCAEIENRNLSFRYKKKCDRNLTSQSADERRIVRRLSADDPPLICRWAAAHNKCCVQAGGTLWNGGDINECEGWTFCTRYTGGGDLADTNSTGQPRTRRLETRQNLSYL
ncbi:hypothetical protein B0H13DRAFT_1894858 [Mycena leptocephala]|nr:hypothetical protein B0H13DRAFT_1894858 [Mycena leptocephala]